MKSPSKKVRRYSSEEEYQKGQMFQEQQNSQASVEDESEPDVDISPKVIKKKKQKYQTSDSEPDMSDQEEDYACMVANLARAHSLVQSTGKISQSILVKDNDGFINITSPGERGYMLMKLELYPFKDCEINEERILEEKNVLIVNSDLWSGVPCAQDGYGSENKNNQGRNEVTRNKNGKEGRNKLEKWLDSFIITPMKNIIYTGHWTNGPYKYLPRNKQILQTCFHNIQQKICDMSYRELFLKTRLISMNKLIYVAPWNNVSEYYYDVANSVNCIEELIKFQFEEDTSAIYNFYKSLYYLVNKKVPKKIVFV